MRRLFPFLKNIDDNQRRNFEIFFGSVCLIIAFASLFAIASYLFTWRSDISLLDHPDPGTLDISVENWAGKLGFYWANFLVTKCFGLASFIIVFFFGTLSHRLLLKKKDKSFSRLLLVSVSGLYIFSFIFAYISELLGLNNLFICGLGGNSGNEAILWANNMFGSVVTLFILAVFLFLWIFYASPKYAMRILNIHNYIGQMAEKRKKRKEEKRERQRLKREKARLETERLAEESEREAEDHVGQVEESERQVEESENEREDRSDDVQVVENQKQEVDVQEQETYSSDASNQNSSQNSSQSSDFNSAATSAATSGAESVVIPGSPTTEKENNVEDSKDAKAETEKSEREVGFEVIKDGKLSEEVKKDLPNINIKDELPRYKAPTLDLLNDYNRNSEAVTSSELERNNLRIRETLENYNIEIIDVKAIVGPTVTLYKVYPAPGVKINTIKNRQEDIAMSLNARGVRIVTLLDSVGIEVANDEPSIVSLKSLLNDDSFRNSKAELPVAIGYTITQKVKVFDLADSPHLLVAGATKQGKSVGLNVLISSLLYSKHPSELKMVFIDPKMVEFTAYSRLLKHYLAILPTAASEEQEMENAVVKTAKDADKILASLCVEMDQRYIMLNKALVNNIKLYNEKYKKRKLLPTKGHKYLPYIVVVLDEYADLTMSVGGGGDAKKISRNIAASIIRLAQKGRAAGIHVVLATQRPSVDVITGLIKTNFPTRIAFRVVTAVDSRTILDTTGAEKLIGKGDMLYYAGVEMERVQCGFVSNDEIGKITSYIGEQVGYGKCYNVPYYLPEVPDEEDGSTSSGLVNMNELDDRFEDAARQVVMNQKGSTSDLQRRLGMGYSRAGRIMDQLEAAGIVGPQEGSKPREVLVSTFDELQPILDKFL